MTQQLDSNQLAEDYISAHLPFKGRSASQVLQDDTVLTSVKIWGKRSFLKSKLRCAYSCLDLANGLKTICRTTKVSDSTNDTIVKQKFREKNKWNKWRQFFGFKESDVMTKEENNRNKQGSINRRNAAIFIPDYEEEQSVNTNTDRKDSLELCDLEDSGHYDMNADK